MPQQRKAMSTFNAKQQRLQMVAGLRVDPHTKFKANERKKQEKKKLTHEDDNEPGTMSHEDIEKWGREFHLQGEQIFQLDAEFETLMIVEKQEVERMKLKAAGKLEDTMLDLAGKKDKEIDHKLLEADGKRKVGVEVDGRSIPLWVFMRYTNVLNDKFKSVQMRLIQAFGIDISNDHVRLDWIQFLNLKRFFELFLCCESELQDIWLKAIDQRGVSEVEEKDFKEFIEHLARGCMNTEPTTVSINFSNRMFHMLEAEGCVFQNNHEEKFIDMKILSRKIREEKDIDIEVFN